MNLYFINGSDNDGESMDLFVRAETPQEAFDLWKEYDAMFGWALVFEDALSTEEPEEATVEDLRIFMIPESNSAGAVNWHTADGASVVAHVNPI